MTAPSAPRRAKTISLRMLLILTSLAVLMPMAVLAGGGVWYTYLTQRELLEGSLLSQAKAAAAVADDQFSDGLNALRLLAASDALGRGDLAAFDREMRQASVSLGGALINLTSAAGEVRLTTVWPLGVYRPGIQAGPFLLSALRDNKSAVSDLVIGPQTHLAEVGVAYPVALPGSPGPKWMLSLYFHPLAFSDRLENLHLPAGWVASIVDRQFRTVARTREQDRFIGHSPPEDFVAAVKRSDAGIIDGTHVLADGEAAMSAFARAPRTGYIAAIGIPASDFFTPLRNTLLRLGGAIAVLALIGALIALRISRRIIRALNDVTTAPPHAIALTYIKEIDELAAAISSAEAERSHAETKLRLLNKDLEARVIEEVHVREAAQRRAVQAERLQALGQLAGGIAHDFNNVLQVVSGCAKLIEKRANGSEQILRSVRLISEAAERGSSVTGRLLVFARRGELKAQPIDVREMLEGMQQILSHTMGGHVSVDLAIEDGLPLIVADKGQLDTALINLATNARDALPEGGVITLGARRSARGVEISVADHGMGMDEATLARASEPFFSTKEVGKGSGLGLATTRAFVEQSGGAIYIESAVGQGTTVTLWLPEVADAAAGVTAESLPPPRLVNASLRLFVVDDDPVVRESMVAALSDAGHDVRSADSGESALAQLKGGMPPDCLITDLSMPGMDGVSFFKIVRNIYPFLPVIVLTGYAHDQTLENAAAIEHFELMWKPAAPQDIESRIWKLLSVRDA